MLKKLMAVTAMSVTLTLPTLSAAFVEEKTIADLPKDIKWLTNNDAPLIGSDKAKKGGTFNSYIRDYPPTFRQIGPNANSGFRFYLDSNQMPLVSLHPANNQWIPGLATDWAFDSNNKTAYFKLNPKAKWSDGKPVTAEDYLFTFKLMVSEHVVAPWYQDFFGKKVEGITKYDDHTIAITFGTEKPKDDLFDEIGWIYPMAKHFHESRLNKDWVKSTNWEIQPNTGAYQISKFKKGKFIEFKRKKDWWGNDLRYSQNRYNVDLVRLKVYRDQNSAWEAFMKGKIDSFGVILPNYWHDKAKGESFDNGHIRKYWIYTETRQPSSGWFINEDSKPFFKDKKVKYAIAHAFNFGKMNEVVLHGDYDRLPNYHTGYDEFTNAGVKARVFDLDKANALLDEAGWSKRDKDGIRMKDGNRLSFNLDYSAEYHTPRYSVIKEEMAKAGIEAVLTLTKGSANYKKIMEKQHDVASWGWSTGFRPSYWQHFHSENAKAQTNNITMMKDAEMDKLIDAYKAATGLEERKDLAHKLQEKIHESGNYIPTWMVPYDRVAAWAWVKVPEKIERHTDGVISPMGTGIAWIDESLEKKVKAGEKLPNDVIKDDTYRLGK